MRTGFSAPSGAADIEQILIWTYHNQLAHILIGRGVGLYEAERRIDDIEWRRISGDGVAACLRDALLGVEIDRSQYQGVVVIAQDAIVVHTVLMVLGPPVCDLIIENARMGTRPDWRPGARFHYEPRWKTVPRWTETGLPRPKSFVIERKYYKNSNRVRTSWCPITAVDDPDIIGQARNRHTAWHAGLLALAEYFDLGGDLPYREVGLGATECPWNGLA